MLAILAEIVTAIGGFFTAAINLVASSITTGPTA